METLLGQRPAPVQGQHLPGHEVGSLEEEEDRPGDVVVDFNFRFSTVGYDTSLWAMRLGIRNDERIQIAHGLDTMTGRDAIFAAHPDWFAVDIEGQPYRAGDRYITCIDSPYYEEYLPGVLREIIEWEKPEGFTDNSWSGLGRESICYCLHSRREFRRATGKELPRKKDWDDFACYEAEINNVIGGTRLLVLCTYSLKKCGVVEILDVVKNHEFALAMNQGEWQIVKMPAAGHAPKPTVKYVVTSVPTKPAAMVTSVTR